MYPEWSLPAVQGLCRFRHALH